MDGLTELIARVSMGTRLATVVMGFSPTLALQKLLAKTCPRSAYIGVIEPTEAFSARTVAVTRSVKLNPAKTNHAPKGGGRPRHGMPAIYR